MQVRICCAVLIYLATGLCANAEWYTGSAKILEDNVQIEFWHDKPDLAEACIESVQTEMVRVDRLISVDNPRSELAKINAHAAKRPVKVSTELYTLIDKALRFGRVTRGAFDISFASVGFLYDYDKRVRPAEKKTKKALQVVDYRLVETNRSKRTVRFLKKGVRIELGGIAKGHAVDRAAKLLSACGAIHALISAGGDTRALSDHRGTPWLIKIRTPLGDDRDVEIRIPLNGQAISTSGDYERHFEQDGVRYHQIINPRTGDSPGELRSVSIVGPDGIWCDALATGVFVLGLVDGLQVIESLDGYEAYLVDRNGGQHHTSGLITQPDCEHQ